MLWHCFWNVHPPHTLFWVLFFIATGSTAVISIGYWIFTSIFKYADQEYKPREMFLIWVAIVIASIFGHLAGLFVLSLYFARAIGRAITNSYKWQLIPRIF